MLGFRFDVGQRHLEAVYQWTTMENNGQQWITMDNNGHKWTTMDNNPQVLHASLILCLASQGGLAF